MAHRQISRCRFRCSLNRTQLLGNDATRKITTAARSQGVEQLHDDDRHHHVMKDVRCQFTNYRAAPSVNIVDTLRTWYPNHTVTQTPKSTGILRFAKSGQAHAKLDTGTDFHASRTYKPAEDHANGPGRLKYKVEFGKYNYRWKDQDFQVYVADFWQTEYIHVQNHYILYARRQADIIDGQSQEVDKLITAASQHSSKIHNEIWVYDRGYWQKNHRLWKNVQACKWDDVILNAEMKLNLINDIEGFFDRKAEYEAFAVPWKVSDDGRELAWLTLHFIVEFYSLILSASVIGLYTHAHCRLWSFHRL